MSYYVQFRWGDSESDPTIDRMREALQELDIDDPEHPDTWLSHESGWTLSAYSSGRLIWSKDASMPRHQMGISRDHVLELWVALSKGEIQRIEDQSWSPGYGP